MRSGVPVLCALAGLLLAGCDWVRVPADPPGETAAQRPTTGRFVHGQSSDISGVYRPVGDVGPDDFTLVQVFIGQASDFEAWEAGRRSVDFAPVMMEFSGLAGRLVRVMPERYAVSDDRIRMSGAVTGLGEVSLDARLDGAALATARRNLGDADAPAMTGVVRIGETNHPGVSLRWSGGD